MRAPFCNDSTELCSDEKSLIRSDTECEESEIRGIERSLGKSHSAKAAVFGICLDDLMGTSAQVVPRIPFILSRLCRYIETHGLRCKNLFLEGDEKNIIENLKLEFIECGDASLESTGSVPSVAKLLIIFFEELPEPLIPMTAQLDFINDMEKLSLSSEDCIAHLKFNVERLPDSTYRVLKYLSRFLLRVACHREHNGMSSDGLAAIFGPLIFRSTSKDPLVNIKLINIVNCFVQEYHTIFEDNVTSNITEDILNPSIQSSVNVCRQLPCPSSVMPVISLSPLSVFIPAMDTDSYENNIAEQNGPALLIEGQVDPPKENGKITDTCAARNNKVGSVTRKRKERRLSGEEAQQRSSSEERPSSSALLSVEKMDIIRRCNSHEEVMEEVKISGEIDIFPKDSHDKVDEIHHADSYLSDTMELVVNEKNHSPHPPNAKRREVDTTDTNMETSSDRWKCRSLSKFCEYKGPFTDIYCHRNSKQNPIAEVTGRSTMDFDASVEEINDKDEFLGSKNASIPRSASCPVPKADNAGSSESESSSLSLSWSMLFEDSEPVRSEEPLSWSLSRDGAMLDADEDRMPDNDETLLSPSVQKLRSNNFYEAPLSPSAYRSYLSHRSSHLDASVPPSPPVEQEDFAKKLVESSGASDSIRQLTKKIRSIKKLLRKFDEKFEAEFGYKPSHAEKSNNPEAKKMLGDLYKARKELKALKEEARLEQVSSATRSWLASASSQVLGDSTNYFQQENVRDRSKPSVEESVGTAMKSLCEERKIANRPESFDDMSTSQVKDEKLAIQKALLHFESIHGKPFTKEERNTIRPLYDRYRNVKKLLVRSGSFSGSVSKNKELCSELQPILEHETMDFSSKQSDGDQDVSCRKKEIPVSIVTDDVESKEPIKEGKKNTMISRFLNSKYDNSNFHELPLSEMVFQLQKVKSEKQHIRKILKEFETEFLKINGRKPQKEDKYAMEALYNEYKHVKARVKLLEALISKHDQHQLM